MGLRCWGFRVGKVEAEAKAADGWGLDRGWGWG